MFFTISKLFWLVFAPANFLTLLLLVGVVFIGKAWAHKLLWLVAVGFLAMAVVPFGKWLLIPLENRFPMPASLPEKVDGIIVLGGSTDQVITSARGAVALDDSAERLTQFVMLANHYKDARLVFTGGTASLVPVAGQSEADTARQFFTEMGLDQTRITYEGESRNSFENAVLTKELVKPKAGEVWILVTSANHLPRAMGIFRKIDWDVVPYPTNYRTDGRYMSGFSFNMRSGIALLDKGLREWCGLVAYYLTGKTESLFPAPTTSPSHRKTEHQE